MSLTGNDLTRKEVGDVRAHLDDFANELVANDHRDGNGLLGPSIPVVDVKVGTADPRLFDTDQDIIDPDGWEWDVLKFQTAAAVVFDQCFHASVRRWNGDLRIGLGWHLPADPSGKDKR